MAKRHLRPEPLDFNIGVPTLMNMEGCMASIDPPAHNSVDVYMKDAFFSGTTSLATKE